MADRVHLAAQQEVLAVRPAQVVVHVHQRPVPVHARQPELAEVGQERVRERGRLAAELVGAACHPVPDREVPLLLGDVQQRVRQLDGLVRHERRQQRQLRPVDVPHGREVERERPVGRPERRLVRRQARLDQRVVERRREDGLLVLRRGVDPDLAQGLLPGRCGRRPSFAKLDGPGPHSFSRFSRAWSTPRSENPNRSSTTCPGSDGPAHISPNGRSVVGRIRSKSSRVPPGMSRRSYQSSCRQRGSSHSTWIASGAPSTTISPCAIPGLIECRCARSGTVRPWGIDSPPSEKSMTSRASRCAGNVYRCTALFGPTVISARMPDLERRRVVAGLGALVDDVPQLTQVVQRLQHRRDAEVVVVLADRARPRLLEVREAAGHLPVVQLRREALGAQVVAAVARRVRAAVRAGADHAQRVRRARVRVADLRFRPPPRLREVALRRQARGLRADERVDALEHPPLLALLVGDDRVACGRRLRLCLVEGDGTTGVLRGGFVIGRAPHRRLCAGATARRPVAVAPVDPHSQIVDRGHRHRCGSRASAALRPSMTGWSVDLDAARPSRPSGRRNHR